MDKDIDNKNNDFLEIFKHEKDSNFKIEHEILFITTDSWLAQLGSRKVTNYLFEKGTTFKSFLPL